MGDNSQTISLNDDSYKTRDFRDKNEHYFM